jgi:hypothetical protein
MDLVAPVLVAPLYICACSFFREPNRRNFKAIGPTYPAALKGRAWIAADSYQIVRLETDLVAPLPEIRLFADHTAIEYSAVHFHR